MKPYARICQYNKVILKHRVIKLAKRIVAIKKFFFLTKVVIKQVKKPSNFSTYFSVEISERR